MSWWEEEEEQIWECGGSDSVLERLRNQPIYSPPPSPTSVFLISPQLYFSQPPPLTPQLHFSPPPTTSVLMFPCLDFLPLPSSIGSLRSLSITEVRSLRPLSITNVIRHIGQIEYGTMPVSHKFSFCSRKDTRYLVTISEDTVIDTPQNQSNPNTQHDRSSPRLIASTDIGEIRQCHSSKPLSRNLEDSLRDFGGTREVVLKCLNKLLWWLPLKLNTDLLVHSLWEACESLPLECFLPPKSKKMVSIWSWLSVVKISRKISIRLFQVLPSVQLPQTLQIVIVEEKMTQSLSCSGEFISQTKDCSLVEERSVEITVEVDATNNGAHGVKAYENFPIVSHSEKKNTRDKLKRSYKSISVITREDLEQNFGSSREDVANSFGISVSTMKRICRKHGISWWPFQPERKKERLMEIISPSMHEKHDSRLRCIQTPLHARSSPRTIALLDGGEMVQLDSSKRQSLVEFDITNNSAHLVRASQSCSTVSHSDETNSRETLKRKCTTECT